MEGEGFVVREKYYDKYYRVLVIEAGGDVVVSVDVYAPKWAFGGPERVCAGDACLLVKELEPPSDIGARRVVVIGSSVRGIEETISVKWVFGGPVGDELIDKVYEYSWRLVLEGSFK